jgi:hypothetical protein
MDIRSTSDLHTPSLAETTREGQSMHQINNSKTVSEVIEDDIRKSIAEGLQKNAQNENPSNVASLIGQGTSLNLMA